MHNLSSINYILANTAATDLNWIMIVINVAGGLALFLFGMTQMTDGLKSATGDGLKHLLAKLTVNRVAATVSGIVVTGLTQSSSVTTVLLVGFVAAGLMTLPQTIGIILGSNIGSTFTAQIIAFNISQYVPLMIAVGFFTSALSRRLRIKSFGTMLLGLGLVFAGMEFMSQATYPLRELPAFTDMMQRMSNPLAGILVGALVTAVIQSSAATTAMVIVLAAQGLITLEGGIAVAFGANVGTCATAVLASIGKPRVAVQVAVANIIFNTLGVLLWVFFIPQFADAIRAISPTSPELVGAERLAAEVPRQIANAHTVFNVVNALLALPFTTLFAKLVQKIVPLKEEIDTPLVEPKYISRSALAIPSAAIDYARLELTRLGKRVDAMFSLLPELVAEDTSPTTNLLQRNRDEVTILYEKVVEYLAAISRLDLTDGQTRRGEALLSIGNHLENLASIIREDAAPAVIELTTAEVTTSPSTNEKMRKLYVQVQEAFDLTLTALREDNPEIAQKVIDMKSDVYQQADELSKHLVGRLGADEPDRVRLFRVESELRGQVKRIYYELRRIAKRLAGEGE